MKRIDNAVAYVTNICYMMLGKYILYIRMPKCLLKDGSLAVIDICFWHSQPQLMLIFNSVSTLNSSKY